ncbi:MAG: Response regulator receiver domain [Chloroflexota bacterium]|jgi:DNA-binding response OmpR family regulator|nr:Response regulator receiver domain [Chloroflexota bacterium]
MKSVFVVEDDPAIAETIRMILEDSYAVTVLESSGALPHGAETSLVITDLLGRNGYDSASAIRTVRETHVRTGAPVLVLTAHGAAKADRELGRVAQAVLTKPFQMDDLLAIVERLTI